jgi:NDP-sugar pyrophosphorylase family protein
MKAIIVISGVIPALCGLDERTPSALLPLGDRPFLQHIIEYLSAAGLREYHFVVGHLPEKIENYFGDGTRWGCRFRYHLSNDSEQPYRPIQRLCTGLEDTVLLAESDCFPLVPVDEYLKPSNGIAFDLAGGEWSGCAVFARDVLKPEWFGKGRSLVESSLRADTRFRWSSAEPCISLKTPLQLLASQQALLSGNLPKLMMSGGSAEPGVWVSRNVVIHPSARITAPVFFGENCRVGRGAQIGPDAVLSRNCIVGDHSTATRSLVMEGSYIGEGLELDQVIVDRNLLVNARLETSVFVSESFLLGGLTDRAQRGFFRKALSALFAAVLLALFLPFFLAALALKAFTGAARVEATPMVALPANVDRRLWTTYSLYQVKSSRGLESNYSACRRLFRLFIPGLVAVCRGKLALVGLEPRTMAQIEALPVDWQKLYLGGIAGLITEASVTLSADASDEELYLVEAVYSAMRSWRRDIQLFCRFFLRLMAFSSPHRLDVDQPVE